jgi:cell division protein FtsL
MNRIIAVLVVLLMGSSWQIIVHQHEIRKLNIELEKEKTRYSDLKMDFHRLELQNSKEAATDHVDAIAREKEEIEAAKKAPKKPLAVVSTSASTNGVNPSTQAATTSGKTEAKPEVKKEDVKTTPTAKIEPKKEEAKKEEPKATSATPVKTEPKKEVKKEDPKPTPKTETKKSEDKKPSVPVVDKSTTPVDKSDKLGELIKSFK